MKFPSDKEIAKIREEKDLFTRGLRNAHRIEEMIGDTACLSARYRELFSLGHYPSSQQTEEVFRAIHGFANAMKGTLDDKSLEELRMIAHALEPLWWRVF